MDKTLDIAKRLNELHVQKFGENMDQLRMHKLMYYVQKQSLYNTNEPIFEDSFEGWRFGPVLPGIRAAYFSGELFEGTGAAISDAAEKLVQEVFQKYEDVSSWDLSRQTHDEFAWQYSRAELLPEDPGKAEIDLDAMRFDVVREKMDELLEGKES